MRNQPAERLALTLALLLVVVAGPAWGQDIDRGKRLAAAWCSSCHQVGPNQGTSDLAPAFEMVANDPTKTEGGLRAWLIDPHPPMPDLNLAEDEIEDLLGYIGSLRSE